MTLESRVYGAPGLVAAVALLSGCFLFEDTRSGGERAPEPETTAAVATFNPTREIAPFPANFLFGFDAQSGLLQVDAPDNPFLNALRDLNGFSTIEPWTTRFTAPLAPETLPEGVRVFVLDSVQPPVEVEGELVFGQDFVAGLQDDGRQLFISPLQPLEPGTNYLVVLTDGLRSSDGGAVVNSLSYRALKGTEALEGEAAQLQALTDAELSAVEAFDSSLERANVVLSWSVRTQNMGHTLQAARASFEEGHAGTRQLHLAPLELDGEPVPAPGGEADLWVGTVNLRYGLGVPTDPGSPEAPVGLPAAAPVLTTHWQCNGASCNTAAAIGGGLTYDATDDELWVPVVAAVPADDGAGEPYPVVLFKHGLRRNRADIVAVASEFAELGYVTVAMDLPLHGIVRDQIAGTDPIEAVTEVLHAESVNALLDASDEVTERTFYLDVDGDDAVDPSGSHYLNVSQPLVLRDNFRQAAADMMVLRRALRNLGLPEGESLRLNADEVYLHAISLGATAAIPFLATDPGMTAAALGVPGAGLARQAVASPEIGAPIIAEFEAEGIPEGSSEFQQIQVLIQTAIDSADPINHANALAQMGDLGVLLTQVVGGSDVDAFPTEPDQVLPPSVPGAPLSGSEPFSRLAGLRAIPTADQELPGIFADDPVRAVVSFTAGAHGSYLQLSGEQSGVPAPNAVEAEMRRQYGSFLGSGGMVVELGEALEDFNDVAPEDILRRAED